MKNSLLNLAMVATAWAVWWSCGNKSSVFDKGTRGIWTEQLWNNYEIRLTVEGEVEGFSCFAFGLKKLRACLHASSLEKITSSKFWWGHGLSHIATQLVSSWTLFWEHCWGVHSSWVVSKPHLLSLHSSAQESSACPEPLHGKFYCLGQAFKSPVWPFVVFSLSCPVSELQSMADQDQKAWMKSHGL